MTYAPKRLAQFVAPTIETTYYTVPVSTFTIIKNVVVANNYPSAVSVNLSVVPTGQLAGFENRIIPGISVPANASISLDLSTVMAAGDFISASATVGSAVSITISGVEESGNGLAAGGAPAASASGIQTVTSGTRPTSPYLGQTVYESDTGRLMNWGGAQWTREQPTATLGYTEVTTDQGTFTGEVDLPNLTVTVTVPAGRRLKITGRGTFSSTAADEVTGYVKEGSTYLGRFAKVAMPAIGNVYSDSQAVIVSPSAGTHTYKLAVIRSGSGTATFHAEPQGAQIRGPAYILVEDITGSPTPYVATSVPVGQLGYSVGTTITTIGAETILPGYSVNVAVPAGRTLRITACGHVFANTTSGQACLFRIKEDGVEVGGCQTTNIINSASAEEWIAAVVRSPAAGTHTYTATAQRNTGADSLTNRISSAETGYLLVEDITPTPAPATTYPSSTLGYAQVTADQGAGFTTATDLTGLSVAVTVPAGRRIRVSGSVLAYATVVDDVMRLSIMEGGTELQRRNVTARPASWGLGMDVSVVLSPSSGTHTYKLQMARDSGTGNVFMQAGAGWPAYIMVEDVSSVATSDLAVPGVLVVTSATRPSTPLAGTLIYETDTGKLWEWDGTAWTLPRNVAGGYLTGVNDLTGTGAYALSKSATEQVFATTAAIQTFANRRYKLTGFLTTTSGGAWTYADVRIRRGTTTSGATQSRMYYPRTGWQTMQIVAFDVPGAQASQQWVLTHALDTSVCDIYGPVGLFVEDVGAA